MSDLRKRHKKWTLETGDMGHMNEPEMIEQMWPGGKQPVTDIPYFIINSPEEPCIKELPDRRNIFITNDTWDFIARHMEPQLFILLKKKQILTGCYIPDHCILNPEFIIFGLKLSGMAIRTAKN